MTVPGNTDESTPFPLTAVQRAYLVGRGEEAELGGVSTHAYFEFDGALDPDRFREALEAVVARHGMLRVVIDPDAGTQRVLADPGPVPVTRLDLRDTPERERAEALSRIRERMSHRVRAPDQWPLFGVALSRLSDTVTRVHVDFDGLAFDLTSWRVVLEDLAAHYREPESVPPAPTMSYRACLESVGGDPDQDTPEARAYWRAQDLPPAPRLSLAAAPAAAGPPCFTAREHRLPGELWDRLRATAASHRVMAAGLCTGAFAEVLARRCQQARFTLIVPCAQRARTVPGADRVVGQFAGFIPVEVDWTAPTFAERVRTLQRRIWSDLRHRAAAGPALIRTLVQRHGTPGAALFPVVFTSGLGVPFPAEPLPGCRQVHAVSQTPQVYFDAQVTEHGAELVVNWDTVDTIVGADTVDVMFAEHTALLERLADPNEWSRHTPVDDTVLTSHTPRVAPRDALEEVLIRVWEEALGVSGLGVADDLADLGSGPAAALVAAEALEEWLPGSGARRGDMLGATTVADLAGRLATSHPAGHLTAVAEVSLEAAALDAAIPRTARERSR